MSCVTARRANQRKPVQLLAQKYSAFVLTQITGITPPVSRQMRDARERHERAVRCDGRGRRARRTRLTRTAKSCGSDVAVLALRSGEAKLLWDNGGKRAVLREEHEVSRKAVAQGRPECSRCPVCSCAVFVSANRTRDRGCSKHPVFPAPSDWRRDDEDENLGRNAPRECGRTLCWHHPRMRVIQYPRDRSDENDRPRRTGSPPARG
jgi:hypothetical protein